MVNNKEENTTESLTQAMVGAGIREFVGIRVTYSDDFINWQLGEEHPINPIRSFALVQRMEELERLGACTIDTDWNRSSQILRNKWEKCATDLQPELVNARKTSDPELWEAELTMFGATHHLTETLIREYYVENKLGVYFNPAGGENNQHEDVAVVSDLAWACKRLALSGLRVAYIDWDAHHCGDVETLLEGSGILTASIHSISSVETPLPSSDETINYEVPVNSTDEDLIAAVGSTIDLIEDRGGVDVLVINIGADGISEDSSSDLGWTHKGYFLSAQIIGEYAGTHDIPVLLGGGGGTLPLDEGTPEVWFLVAGTLTMEISRQQMKRLLASTSEDTYEHSDYSTENLPVSHSGTEETGPRSL